MPEADARRIALTALTVAAVAAVLRLPGLAEQLWLDEVATVVNYVTVPFWDIVSTYDSPNNHVLNSLLAHVSVALFGESAWSVRLPAFVFGVATVPAVFLMAREWLAEGEALGASLVVAASYHHVYFSQNARGYTGFLFFSVLSTLFLARALRGGGRGAWVGWAVAGALNVYALLSGLFVVVGQVVGVLVLHVMPARGRELGARFRTLVTWTSVAAGLTLLLHAPLLAPMFRFYTTVEADVGWLPSTGLLGEILRNAIPTRNASVLVVGALMGAPVLVAGLVRLWRRAPLTFFAFLLPPLLELTVAVALGAGSYPRRFLLVMPFAALTGVCGVRAIAAWIGGRLRSPMIERAVFATGVAMGALAVAAGLGRLYRLPFQDFQGALAWVSEARGPGDRVVALWVATGPASYYQPGIGTARTPAEFRAQLDGNRKVWVLGTMLEDMSRREPALTALLEERFLERARFPGVVGDGAVVVFESR